MSMQRGHEGPYRPRGVGSTATRALGEAGYRLPFDRPHGGRISGGAAALEA